MKEHGGGDDPVAVGSVGKRYDAYGVGHRASRYLRLPKALVPQRLIGGFECCSVSGTANMAYAALAGLSPAVGLWAALPALLIDGCEARPELWGLRTLPATRCSPDSWMTSSLSTRSAARHDRALS